MKSDAQQNYSKASANNVGQDLVQETTNMVHDTLQGNNNLILHGVLEKMKQDMDLSKSVVTRAFFSAIVQRAAPAGRQHGLKLLVWTNFEETIMLV